MMTMGDDISVLAPSGVSEALRVRMGAAPDTAPDVLVSLARDPSVTVRAAVAMNPAAGEADRLLAQDQDERVRTLLARKLASLVPDMAAADREVLNGHVLATLHRLVSDEAVRVREAIADVVKDMPEAPRSIVLALARDAETGVHDPVVRLSPLLGSEDLLALLAARPDGTVAISVAARPGLSEEVADAVAATSNARAITALLANSTAAIRESTLDALAAAGAAQEAWHQPLVARPKLSERAARALSDYVATHLLEVLAGRADMPVAVTRDLRQRLQARLNPAPAARREPDIDQAMQEARRLQAAGRLDEAALLGAIQRGEARMATAILAAAADFPASVVDRAATLRSAKGLISLVWKAGFTMQVAVPLQTLLARMNPGMILRPAPGGGFPLAVDEMRWQIEFLRDMGR